MTARGVVAAGRWQMHTFLAEHGAFWLEAACVFRKSCDPDRTVHPRGTSS